MPRRPIEAFEVSDVLSEFGLGQPTTPGVIADIEYPYDHSPHAHQDIRTELGNQALPVFEYKDEINSALRDNPVIVVVAETGAGKSTQIPQFALDEGYKKVYITQPRRTAARNVFMRIREEVAQVRGDYAADDLVSYQTAGEKEGGDDAKIVVVTDGLHLVKELNDKGVLEDEVLIIDEAHEWNSNIEVLIAWTKQAVTENPKLRIVIMSATIDSAHLADFYGEDKARPPIIEIKNRNHTVKCSEKPDSTVVEEAVNITNMLSGKKLSEDEHAGILIFEPGKRETQDAMNAIRSALPKDVAKKVKIFPLHAKLSKEEQQAALAQYPGFVKIVVSTDVAQTSLTIPDIKYVIDSGFQRRVELDHEGTPGLKRIPTSQADCDQRAGRTGRVGDGFYILTRLNDSLDFTPYYQRDLYPVPEIMRTDISRNLLRLLELDIDIGEFDMYHRASEGAIELAKDNLQILGALDDDNQITKIGLEMNRYPACASSGRMLVESMHYNPAIRSYVAAFTAVKEAGGLQYYSQNSGKRWEPLSQEATSDMLFQLDLFIAAQHMSHRELKDHDLDIDNFARALEQYQKIAKLAGAPAHVLETPDESEREDILRCIYTGYTPYIYKYAGSDQYVHAYRDWQTLREVSNRSAVASGGAFLVGDPYRIEIGTEDVTTRQSLENINCH